MRQISQSLDEVLAKQPVPETGSSSNNYLDVDTRIKSANKMIESIEKELEVQRQQLDVYSYENKSRLLQEIQEIQGRLKETVNRNRELKKQLKDGANRINIQATDPEEAREIKALTEELRVAKEKLKEIDNKYNHLKKQNDNAVSKIAQLENQASGLGIDLNSSPNPKKPSKAPSKNWEEEPSKPALESGEILELKEAIAELDSLKLAEEPKWRKRVAEVEAEKSYYEESKEKAAKSLREKEQETRLKDLEIKDLKRTIRTLRMKSGNLASAPDLNIEVEDGKRKKEGKQAKYVVPAKNKPKKINQEETKEEPKPKEIAKNKNRISADLVEEEKPKQGRGSKLAKNENKKEHSHNRKDSDEY